LQGGIRDMSRESIILENERLLKIYKDGRDVSDENMQRVTELASIGMMNKGLSLKRQKITAKTTSFALKFIS